MDNARVNIQGYWMQIDVHMMTSVTITVSRTDLTTSLFVWMDTALVITQKYVHTKKSVTTFIVSLPTTNQHVQMDSVHVTMQADVYITVSATVIPLTTTLCALMDSVRVFP